MLEQYNHHGSDKGEDNCRKDETFKLRVAKSPYFLSVRSVAEAGPGVLGVLDIPGVDPDTVRYLARSVLGYVFFQKGLTADIMIDGEPAKAFIIVCQSPEASSAAFEQYISYLKGSGTQAEPVSSEGGATLNAQDPLYKGMFIRRSGAYILGVTKMKDPLKASSVIGLMQSRIGKP